jgi:hypothetical protein
MTKNIFNKFKKHLSTTIDDDLNSQLIIADKNKVCNLQINKPINVWSDIFPSPNVEAHIQYTLLHASLSRFAVHKKQDVKNNQNYYLLTGTMDPVKIQFNIDPYGKNLTILDFICQEIEIDYDLQLHPEKLNQIISSFGIDFSKGMPLLFQSFQPSKQSIDHLIHSFVSAGAVEITKELEETPTLVCAYQAQKPVPITSFKCKFSSNDNPKPFLNFADAVCQNIDRIFRSVILPKALSDRQKETIQLEYKDFFMKDSFQWLFNWSGSCFQDVSTLSSALKQRNYSPVFAPFTSLTILVNDSQVTCDLD